MQIKPNVMPLRRPGASSAASSRMVLADETMRLLIALVLWLIILYLAKIFVAALLGRALLGPIRPGVGGFAVPLFIGLLLVFIAVNVPYVGGLVKLGVLVLGLGLAFEWLRRSWPRGVAPSPA